MQNAPAVIKTTALPALQMSETDLMNVLRNSLYPGAKGESIKLVINYCKAAGLDPMQKPVHIVPMSVSTGEKDENGWDKKTMRDVVMPGIGLYRTQAARTGDYAGITEPEFGEDVTEKLGEITITYPKWCRVTVRRIVQGQIVEFAAREFWKENYATKSSKASEPNAMWKRRPYAQLAKCFDPQTEVLTTAGFQRFNSVTGQILQVTDAGLAPCDAHPFMRDYDGEMIVADGTRLNFSVTPNHDMLTTAGKIEAWALYEQATKVGNKFLIPRAPVAHKPDALVADTVLQLLGYFLADGSHTGYRQIRIAVSRPHKIEALRDLALHQHEGIKRDAGRIAQAGNRTITSAHDKVQFVYDYALIEPFVQPDKAINVDQLLLLSQRQARVVTDALLAFDGSDNGVGVRRLAQGNANVLRAFEVAAVHAGYSISARADRQSDIGAVSSVTVSDAPHFPVVRGVEKNSASLVKRRNVAGKVWCVTVPSGVIVVRRKGFSMLCGNCAEAQALRKAFPEFGAQPTADEMEGKELYYDENAVIDASTGEILRKPAVQQPQSKSKPRTQDGAMPRSRASGPSAGGDPTATDTESPKSVGAQATTTSDGQPESRATGNQVYLTPGALRILTAKLIGAGYVRDGDADPSAVCVHFGIESPDRLTMDQINSVYDWLAQNPKK